MIKSFSLAFFKDSRTWFSQIPVNCWCTLPSSLRHQHVMIHAPVSFWHAAAVGTLVSKTMLAAANAPYAAPAPGGTLVSLDVFSLQVGCVA
jgi:hypothetical protein